MDGSALNRLNISTGMISTMIKANLTGDSRIGMTFSSSPSALRGDLLMKEKIQSSTAQILTLFSILPRSLGKIHQLMFRQKVNSC